MAHTAGCASRPSDWCCSLSSSWCTLDPRKTTNFNYQRDYSFSTKATASPLNLLISNSCQKPTCSTRGRTASCFKEHWICGSVMFPRPLAAEDNDRSTSKAMSRTFSDNRIVDNFHTCFPGQEQWAVSMDVGAADCLADGVANVAAVFCSNNLDKHIQYRPTSGQPSWQVCHQDNTQLLN